MKFINEFNQFLANEVNLSQVKLDQLDERVGAADRFLASSDDEIASRFVQTIPQGSYAHRTIINPVGAFDEFDADLLLELTEEPDWSPADYVEELYKAFRASATYRGMVSRHCRCVKVNYAGDFHIDVVPYVERHGSHYITNRDDDIFELTNPEGFNAWLDGQDQLTGGKLIKVIRLVKYLGTTRTPSPASRSSSTSCSAAGSTAPCSTTIQTTTAICRLPSATCWPT